MEPIVKQLLKRIIGLTPFRVTRARDLNRFQAIDETLALIARRGFAPRVVIDGGANVGDFARLARRVFGAEPEIHLFEPQPACQPSLESLARDPRVHLHAVALGAAEGGKLALAIDPLGVTTGAHIAPSGSGVATVSVGVATLDALFESRLERSDRVLLKLDLQGWELEALKGATKSLPRVEVVLIEVSLYAQAYEPPISAIVGFLDNAGFELHDIASLSGRFRDNRARQADLLFVNRRSDLCSDTSWA
ncbi:MAG TPA: FkbM family methyltransferase [Sphingomonadaceae bacterium]|nr:FkbM family methyltransferase [Sphingomonadaceae bacterium]